MDEEYDKLTTNEEEKITLLNYICIEYLRNKISSATWDALFDKVVQINKQGCQDAS